MVGTHQPQLRLQWQDGQLSGCMPSIHGVLQDAGPVLRSGSPKIHLAGYDGDSYA